MKKILIAAAIGAAALALTGCTSQADTESDNLSKQADNFEVNRTIILQDDITGTVTQELTGRCSLGNNDSGRERTVTCKIGAHSYVKEIFVIGDNSTLTAIQTDPLPGDPYAYKFIVKPTTIDFDLQTPNHNAGGN